MQEGLQEIINGCMRRDSYAQGRLYDLFCDRMLGVCMWYATNKEEAEEILQDGFIRVFTYIHTYKGGSLSGWIRKIMVNAALQKLQNGKNNPLRLAVEYEVELHNKIETASILESYDNKELLNLIQSLPPVYRAVFSLHVLEGWKHREIAILLGISEGTSKSNLSDARAILQKKVYQLQRTTI